MANLFIGLGGSGVKTVRNLKKLGREDDYFLVVDSAEQEIADFDDHEIIDMSTASVTDFLKNDKSALRDKASIWLDSKASIRFPSGPLKDGASANRPLGRLAVTQIYKSFQEKIDKKIAQLKEVSDSKTQKLQTYVVFSVAGGTGSSIFLDLNQKILENLTKAYGPDKFEYPYAIIYMPTFFVNQQPEKDKIKYYSNVFACWKEIDGFQRDYFRVIEDLKSNSTVKTNFHHFAIDSASNMDNMHYSPFKHGILFDLENSNGTTYDIKEFYSNVGHYLSIISNIKYGSLISEEFNNNLKDDSARSVINNEPWVRNYLSAGYQEIKGVSDLYKKYIYSQIRLNVFQSLKGSESSRLNEIIEFSEKLITNELLSRIDDNDSYGYSNKRIIASSENDLKNLYDIIDEFIENKYVIEQDTFYKNSISAKSSVSLINYFEDSINVKFQNDLSQHIKINGFDITNSKKIILLKIYEEIKAFVFPNGFTQVLEVLKNLDSKIDELYIHYKSELESLPLENSSENIKNSDLIDEIRNQSAKIEKGPGLFDRDSKFYNTEILKLNNLIKCYFDYTKKTVSLELKELICLEISKDKSEIESFKRVKDLIEKLSEKIDGKLDEKNIDDTNKSKVESLKYLATNSLIDEYHKIKNSKLTSYIPNVGDFVATKDSFEDEQINIFKYSYLNECGFETLQENGVKSILRKKNQSKNIGSLNLEILLENVLDSQNNYIITQYLNGEISADNFISTFSNLLEKNLINNLSNVLKDKYTEKSNKKIDGWIADYKTDFDKLAIEFKNKTAIFSNFRDIKVNQKNIWLCPDPNTQKALINSLNKNANADRCYPTDEDSIIQISYKSGLSIDEYVHYNLYEKTYRQNLDKDIFPHIDVRFKDLMLEKKINENVDLPIGPNWIYDKIKEIGRNSNGQIGQVKSSRQQEVISLLSKYGQCLFLSSYYDILIRDINLSKEIFKIQEDYKRYFEQNNSEVKALVFLKNDDLKLLSCKEFNKFSKRGYMNFSGNPEEHTMKILKEDTIEDEMFAWLDDSYDISKVLDNNNYNFKEQIDIIKLNLNLSRERTTLESIIIKCMDEVENNYFNPLLKNLSSQNRDILIKAINEFIDQLRKDLL